MRPKMIDHVAFWVSERDAIAAFLERHVGLRTIDRQASFTLLGVDARRFKLTLFDAEGPREPGLFGHVALRVSDLAAARAALPPEAAEIFDAGEGVRITLVEAETDVEYDLDHVALGSARPEATAAAYEYYGFHRSGPARVALGGAWIEFHATHPSPSDRPLLNHLAVLVDSVETHIAAAIEVGIDVESTIDAENTYVAFLAGPEGVRIEYVEHKPTFSLI